MTIGILLPGSTTYPLLSANFKTGLNGSLAQLPDDFLVHIVTTGIGFGTDGKLLLSEAETMFIEKKADLLIVFADHPVVECLFALSKALKKLLIIVNSGAKYPPAQSSPYVIYHTLNHALQCRLVGKEAAKTGNQAVIATSFYDGGYSLCHAIGKGYTDNQGTIVFNFVSKHLSNEFEINDLADFLHSNTEVRDILAVYSDLSPLFYENLASGFPAKRIHVFANPAMLEEFHLPEDEIIAKQLTISSYLAWFRGVATTENTAYCQYFKEETNRTPDSFGALGWDTGVIIRNYIKVASENPDFQARQILAQLKDVETQGAKGTLLIKSESNQVFSSVYQVILGADNQLVVKDTVPLKQVLQEWDEIRNDLPDGHVSGWVNTYMCS